MTAIKSPLSRRMQSEGLEALLGGWISICKEIIEGHHGIINKYLGDGFLAYWPDATTDPEGIAAVILALKELQTRNAPDFRIVVHFGLAAIGGIASMGEESLMGSDVNFVFRLEKLAGSLGESCGLSESARAKLGARVQGRALGGSRAKGLRGQMCLFRRLIRK